MIEKIRRIAAAAVAAALACAMPLSAGAATEVRSIAGGGAYSGLYFTGDEFIAADSFNKVVWSVDMEGRQTLLAGNIGVKDASGEPAGQYIDGTLDTAFFSSLWDIEPFMDGYAVTDTDSNTVRYIDLKNDLVQTCCGDGEAGLKDGFSTEAELSRPTGLASDSDGCLYISDTDNDAIRCLDTEGKLTTLATGINGPTGLEYYDGLLYVCETDSSRILTVDPESGSVEVFAGIATEDGGDTDGPAAEAMFNGPEEIKAAENGIFYVADTENGSIRRIADGMVSTYAAAAEGTENVPVEPKGLWVIGSDVYAGDVFSNTFIKTEEAGASFDDVADTAWYREAVDYVSAKGIMNGTGNNLFSPDRTLDRAMFVRMLTNIQDYRGKSAVPAGKTSFADVPADTWYTEACSWAAENVIAAGTGNNRFSPLASVTRQDMAVFLYRYAKFSGEDVSVKDADAALKSFKDADEISAYAEDALAWASEQGILKGSAGRADPKGTATRAQAAQIIKNYMSR